MWWLRTQTGKLSISKALTTPRRAFEGINAALADVAATLGLSVRELLAASESFTYGTTRATNAIVEGKTARTAFFTTYGFPDILLLREGGKLDPFRQMPYPPPYVPRYLTFEIEERIDSEGDVFLPLNEGSVLAALERCRDLNVQAIGVSLLWSIVNPAHELRVGALIAETLPGLPFTLSHQLNPIVREYRRTSSCVIDASLKPLMQEHLCDARRGPARRRVRRTSLHRHLVRRLLAAGRGHRAARSTRSAPVPRWRRWRP